MKDRIDFRTVRALLKKNGQERRSMFRERNFDLLGFLLRIVLIGAIVALFVVFFGKFCDVYLAVKTAGKPDPLMRGGEMLSILYAVIVLGMTISCLCTLGRELFKADDNRLYSALPVGAKTLFVAKLIAVYAEQAVISVIVVLAVNLTYGLHAGVGGAYWATTVALCFLLPLIAMALASVVLIPFQMLKRFFKDQFILFFIAATVALGLFFWVYSILIDGVKELLLGDSLRYFFNDRVIGIVSTAASLLYPGRWIGNILTGADLAVSWVGLLVWTAAGIVLSVLAIRFVLQKELQQRNEGTVYYTRKRGALKAPRSRFVALIKREFLVIFRTPSYAFSYFSVALVMPIMVYTCMDIASSLVMDLVGLNCDLELAIFLNMIFAALTNVFCGTNISRDGKNFYLIKAMPVSCKEVFFSKIVLCLAVMEFSQAVTAVLLAATSLLLWYDALFMFAVGSLFGFVYICVATRYDFNHAHFSAESDGEIKESGGTVSVTVVFGMAVSFVTGGLLFLLRIMEQFRMISADYLTYLLAPLCAVLAVGAALFFLMFRLRDKYRDFMGGGL